MKREHFTISNTQYTVLNYLQSTAQMNNGNDGQFIFTGYTLTENYIRVKTKCIFLKMYSDGSGGGSIIAGRSSSGGFQFQLHRNGLRLYNGNGAWDTTSSHKINQEFVVDIICNGSNQSINVNGSTYSRNSSSYIPLVCGNELALFNSWRRTYPLVSCSCAKIYYLQIYNSAGTLVRDYIPVLRNSDNKPGMFDKVNELFQVNAYPQYGEFLYG